jgi:hypothetical protein
LAIQTYFNETRAEKIVCICGKNNTYFLKYRLKIKGLEKTV